MNLSTWCAGGVCLFKVTPEMHIECLYLNKGCCRLFGTSQESSRLRAYRLDELLHPDDRSGVFQAIGRAMAVGEEVDCECRVRVHEGEFIWCQLRAGIQRYQGECRCFTPYLRILPALRRRRKRRTERRSGW